MHDVPPLTEKELLPLTVENVTGTVRIDGHEAISGEHLPADAVLSTQKDGFCRINLGDRVAAYVAGAKVVPNNEAFRKDSVPNNEAFREDFENVYITVVKCEFPPSSVLTKYLCGGQTFYELHTEAGSVRIRE